MKPDVLLADFTGVYGDEGFLAYLQERNLPFSVVGLGDIEGTGCYCDPGAEEEIHRRLAPLSGAGIRWLDSGDYHYMTKILAGFQKDPFVLVLMDNHPDDQLPVFGGVLSCGSWVQEMKSSFPLLDDVWTLGPEHRIRNAAGTVDRILEEGIDDMLELVEGHRLYLSVDKDILSRDEARTDWSQGAYRLDALEGWIGRLLEKEVVAVDVCGELSLSKGASPEDLRVNFETNVNIQEFILNCLKR